MCDMKYKDYENYEVCADKKMINSLAVIKAESDDEGEVCLGE